MLDIYEEKEDIPPFIRFERVAEEDKKKTLEAGMVQYKNVDYALITPPYSKDLIRKRVDRWFDHEEHNVRNGRISRERFELYKKMYESFKKGEEIPIEGTPIKGWQALNPAQQKTVIGARIRTVEELAGCNDEGLRRLGMGGRDLVNKAKSWLNAASSNGKVAMQNAQLIKENEQLKTTVDSLTEKVDYLIAQMEQKADNPTFAEDNLEEQYIAKFGKKPHHMMKEETIRQKLEE